MIDDELEQPQSGAEGYQSPDIATGTAEEGGIESSSETPVMGTEEDAANILHALQNARPSWLDQPQPGAEGYQSPAAPQPSDSTTPSGWNKTDFQAPFPESTDTITSPVAVTAVVSKIYSFEMEDATDNEGGKVLIHDGEVSANGGDGVIPEGMGNDDFIIPIATDGDDVWVEVTYDTSTLAITSATIASGTGIPESTLGDAYFLLGYVTFGTVNPDTGLPSTVDPHNTQCGDINILFSYGAGQGIPVLYVLAQLDAHRIIT